MPANQKSRFLAQNNGASRLIAPDVIQPNRLSMIVQVQPGIHGCSFPGARALYVTLRGTCFWFEIPEHDDSVARLPEEIP